MQINRNFSPELILCAISGTNYFNKARKNNKNYKIKYKKKIVKLSELIFAPLTLILIVVYFGFYYSLVELNMNYLSK